MTYITLASNVSSGKSLRLILSSNTVFNVLFSQFAFQMGWDGKHKGIPKTAPKDIKGLPLEGVRALIEEKYVKFYRWCKMGFSFHCFHFNISREELIRME